MKIKKAISIIVVAYFLVFSATFCLAQESVQPELMGMDGTLLDQRIARVVKSYMADKTIPGATVLVARHSKVCYLKSFGKADKNTLLANDAIFRIYSMTKIITAVAVMQLVDKGHIYLSEPISKYLPKYNNMEVVEFDKDGMVTGKVRAKREIIIQDCLTMTSGMSMAGPMAKLFEEAGVGGAIM
jgi:CubicO group peptidase (beta-lactamase class C family)